MLIAVLQVKQSPVLIVVTLILSLTLHVCLLILCLLMLLYHSLDNSVVILEDSPVDRNFFALVVTIHDGILWAL